MLLAEGIDGIERLLEMRILGGELCMVIAGSLVECIHDGRRERPQLHPCCHEPLQRRRVHGIVLAEHPLARRIARAHHNRLVGLGQAVPALEVYDEMQHAAAFHRPSFSSSKGQRNSAASIVPCSSAALTSTWGICWGATPTRARTGPPRPEMRQRKPLSSSTELNSFLNQAPICTPVSPAGIPTTLSLLSEALTISAPPPKVHHACCRRLLNPNGMPVPKPSVGSLAT